MFGRSKTKKSKSTKKVKKSETKKSKAVAKESPKKTQKGRGNVRVAKRDLPQPKKTKKQPSAGPPLKIGGKQTVEKPVTATTPEEVVKNIRRQMK